MPTENTSSAGKPVCQFSLACYTKGDEQDILTMFNDVFSSHRDVSHWNWQFAMNPYDKPRAILARDVSSQNLVGQYTVQPVSLNMMGKPVKAAQSLDTMVHPDYRMQGVFEASAKDCFGRLQQDGYALVYGFPNRNSFPGFMRKLSWHRIAFLSVYTKHLSIAEYLERLLKSRTLARLGDFVFRQLAGIKLKIRQAVLGRAFKGAKVGMSESVPDGYDDLWNAVRSYEVLSLWKDANYFRWRYDQNPNGPFTYHFIERNGKIEALAVSVVKDGGLRIMEFVARDRQLHMARYLILNIILKALSSKVSQVSFTGSTPDFFDEAFHGFSRATSASRVFCLGILDKAVSPFTIINQNNWTVTEGDCDSC